MSGMSLWTLLTGTNAAAAALLLVSIHLSSARTWRTAHDFILIGSIGSQQLSASDGIVDRIISSGKTVDVQRLTCDVVACRTLGRLT